MQSSESIPAVRNEKIHAAFLRSKFKNHSETVRRIIAHFSDAELLAEHVRHQQYRAAGLEKTSSTLVMLPVA